MMVAFSRAIELCTLLRIFVARSPFQVMDPTGAPTPIVPIAMNTSDATARSAALVPVWAMALAAATVSSRVLPAWPEPPGPASKPVRGVADPVGRRFAFSAWPHRSS